jgi:hypothetical protein
MSSEPVNNSEVLLWALYELGGADDFVDVESAFFRAFELAPLRLGWRGHSAVKRYLGPGPKFPHQDSPTARAVIAEIVAGEAARLVMERKYRTNGDLDGPAFYAEHLLYLEKYLARCHRLMLVDTGAAKHVL